MAKIETRCISLGHHRCALFAPARTILSEYASRHNLDSHAEYICASALRVAAGAIYSDKDEVIVTVATTKEEAAGERGFVLEVAFVHEIDDDETKILVTSVTGPEGEWDDWREDDTLYPKLERDILAFLAREDVEIIDSEGNFTLWFGFSHFPS